MLLNLDIGICQVVILRVLQFARDESTFLLAPFSHGKNITGLGCSTYIGILLLIVAADEEQS